MSAANDITHADVLVVGAGPAGLAAATAAARHGCDVHVLDDNLAPGGQIWRASSVAANTQSTQPMSSREKAIAALHASGATLHCATRVFAAPANNVVDVLEQDEHGLRYTYRTLIVATGARELMLPFPGWTLPGVLGAGGLQALVRAGYSVAGKRVAVVGTGPLLIAVAAHLQEAGARVVLLAEQAGLRTMLPLAASMLLRFTKLRQGLHYAARLRGTPVRMGWWPVEAIADRGVLAGVRITNGSETRTIDCDLVATGFHLVPNSELAELLGCALAATPVGRRVLVDTYQRTTRADVFCVGEPTGIAGLDAALLQGEIAGLTAAGQPSTHLHARAAAERAFGKMLDRTFRLRKALRTLAAEDTILCRCEDASFAQVKACAGWTEAKLQTRCGMGPCQGRICGPATRVVFGWEPASVRPPLVPVPLHALISSTSHHEENL
ncbi:FAD/NAD(P)-binding oxidoreductase [Acidipila sp. EB88]|uniref:NAD(P)/FAD-dependent oxidoreductase n=1 Tax=Acidipila sp. EB88 TaxID=2305226 RepID=UPI000F5FC8C0|nr:FAD/NAD(P)-binding oxidoreductase [Acidipila sp. EB88]RRA49364.1 NAD(P)/FAD-dependent oxidoreductase [Acidipila sp. EB88]